MDETGAVVMVCVLAVTMGSLRALDRGWAVTLIHAAVVGTVGWMGLVLAVQPILGLGLEFEAGLGPRVLGVPLVAALGLSALAVVTGGLAEVLLGHSARGREVAYDGITWLASIAAMLQLCALLAAEPGLRALGAPWHWSGGGAYFGAPHGSALWLGCVAFLGDAASRKVRASFAVPRTSPRRRWYRPASVLVFGTLGAVGVVAGDPAETRLIGAFAVGVPTAIAMSRLVPAQLSERGEVRR